MTIASEEESAVKKSVSLPRDLNEKAELRAREQHRTFSSYIQSLVARDLERAKKGDVE